MERTVDATPVQVRLNRDELLGRVANRLAETGAADGDAKACLEVVHMVYEMFEDELVKAVARGEKVSLTGFGAYFMKAHKGHPVQFGSVDSRVEDYKVFRFSPSNVLNRRLRHMAGATK